MIFGIKDGFPVDVRRFVDRFKHNVNDLFGHPLSLYLKLADVCKYSRFSHLGFDFYFHDILVKCSSH